VSTPHGQVADRYELIDRIGEGGAAIVYRARDTRLDRVVALKMLRESFGGDAEFQRRFQREARAAASLNHPNIVDVYDYGEARGTYYIAMEYVEGGSLKDEIRASGRLPPARARDVAQQVLAALEAAHARGLVHRDVKPQNVLLDAAGVAKLTDFGIVHAPDAIETTQVGMTVGTAAYIAPEQATGGLVGPATDVYGVGILLYEMLTGKPPFEGGTPFEVAYRQVNEPVPPPSQVARGVPADLEAIVLRALQKDPLARFGSAQQMADALAGGFAVDVDSTQRMQTVRMRRVAPSARVAAVAPVVVAAPPPRGGAALVVTLGVLGGMAVLALLLALTAQQLGFFGGPPRTPLPAATPTVPPTFTPLPGKPAAVAPPPTLTATATTTTTITPTPTRTTTGTATVVPATATAPPTSTAAPTNTPPPTPAPALTPIPPPPTITPPLPAPPTLTPTVQAPAKPVATATVPPAKPAPPTNTPPPAPSPTPVAPVATPTTPAKPAAPSPTVPPKP
jgi:tRNA A-37 threonylcarbamoyl transferase component Bud32